MEELIRGIRKLPTDYDKILFLISEVLDLDYKYVHCKKGRKGIRIKTGTGEYRTFNFSMHCGSLLEIKDEKRA